MKSNRILLMKMLRIYKLTKSPCESSQGDFFVNLALHDAGIVIRTFKICREVDTKIGNSIIKLYKWGRLGISKSGKYHNMNDWHRF